MPDDLAYALRLAEAIAARHFEGRLTLGRTPAGWTVHFGPATPVDLETHASLADALFDALVEPVNDG